MNKIYEGQTKFTLTLDSGINLTDITGIDIEYKKPNGDTGRWKGSVQNTVQGLVYYDQFKKDELTAGTWKVWLKLTDKNRKVAYGQPATFRVYVPGN